MLSYSQEMVLVVEAQFLDPDISGSLSLPRQFTWSGSYEDLGVKKTPTDSAKGKKYCSSSLSVQEIHPNHYFQTTLYAWRLVVCLMLQIMLEC